MRFFALAFCATLLVSPGSGLAQTSASSGPEADSGPEAMVLIPEGAFTMGRTKTTPDDESGMRPLILRDDRPPHTVQLDAYWMDVDEATHSDYARFVKATGRSAPRHWVDGIMPAERSDHPIYNVDWHDARAYCEWSGKRLPTEAEWERAARGGTEGATYPWGDDKATSSRGRYQTPAGPGPVGAYPPNAFGLRDMAGSVSEWCSDWFERTYYEHSPAANPSGPNEGLYKIIRGGAWSDGAKALVVYFRNWVRPNQKSPNLGFRCVQDAD